MKKAEADPGSAETQISRNHISGNLQCKVAFFREMFPDIHINNSLKKCRLGTLPGKKMEKNRYAFCDNLRHFEDKTEKQELL